MIGLIDCNNFFVSCERLFQPAWRRQPVVVLSSNDGCVVARSQEVKDIGIPMGVPYFQIKDIVKDNKIIVRSGNITLYRDLSRRVFAEVRELFPRVEQYSIDEAFFEIEPDTIAEERCQLLKDKIEQRVGIPVTIGVANSKTQAKCAVAHAKQSAQGWFVANDEWWSKTARMTPVGEIWGVGRRLVDRYTSAQLTTVADIMVANPVRLGTLFGVAGVRLQAELQGWAVFPVETVRPLQKSLMNSRSFARQTSDLATILDAVTYHARHIAAELRAMNAVAGSLRVALQPSRHGDYVLRGGSDCSVLTVPTNDTFTLIELATEGCQRLYDQTVPYQKVGVSVAEIHPTDSVSPSLLSSEQPKDRQSLLATIDRLNTRGNGELITVGSRLRTKRWQPKAVAKSAAYTTQWSDICTVSAQ